MRAARRRTGRGRRHRRSAASAAAPRRRRARAGTRATSSRLAGASAAVSTTAAPSSGGQRRSRALPSRRADTVRASERRVAWCGDPGRGATCRAARGDPAGPPTTGHDTRMAMSTARPEWAQDPSAVSEHLTLDDRIALLRYMLLMRGIEERAMNLYRQGKVPGSFYDGYGQEAVSVGATFAMSAADRLCILHRDLGAHLIR